MAVGDDDSLGQPTPPKKPKTFWLNDHALKKLEKVVAIRGEKTAAEKCRQALEAEIDRLYRQIVAISGGN